MSFLTVFNILASLLGILGGTQFSKELVFKSAESKTKDGGDVFNKIQFMHQDGRDIWKMNQSHYGLNSRKWDNIKIIVDKRSNPPVVSFHQTIENKDIEYSANCLRCHSNGPRLIRPTQSFKFSLKERITLTYWNLTIKSYGKTLLKKVPLTYNRKVELKLPQENIIVSHKKCIKCHSSSGARNSISSFQRGSILHLLKTNEMPPWPYKITQKEKNEIISEIHEIN